MTTQAMSASSLSSRPTPQSDLEQALKVLKDKASCFAKLSLAEKAALVRRCIPRLHDTAQSWVEEGSRAKGLDAAQTGEEWLSGPLPTLRMARLLAESLESAHKHGAPPLGAGHRTNDQGRLCVNVFPSTTLDRATFPFFTGSVLLNEGVDLARARESQARVMAGPREGELSVILGAGNVSSIPPMDALSGMFVDGRVVCLKMNPVNEWLGPFLERALAPLIEKGFLRIVYGGAEVGAFLVSHALVNHVHITGSNKTHDAIVWGADAAEQRRRKSQNDPLLKIPITSELGNISPVAIVPAEYRSHELWFQAQNLATMVTNNASFNCNAAKMLVTSKHWKQRDRFFEMFARALGQIKPRRAYYPGAHERYQRLTQGRDVLKVGQAQESELPWTLIKNVAATSQDDALFTTEPFCSILSEISLESRDPLEFLAESTAFMNDTLWGTLNAAIVIPGRLERDAALHGGLESAIRELRYGTVAINHWPALGYGLASMPWGGHGSSTLADIQSGLGWVHNTCMLGEIDKSVIRGPVRAVPKPVWFSNHSQASRIGPKIVAMEASPSWLKVPAIAALAIRG